MIFFPFSTAVIESESAPEESAANLTFEVEKPQEPIEDVPAAKVEVVESLEAETPLEIVQDEPIKVEEPIEEPAVVSESPAPASAPQELVLAEEPLAAVAAEPVLEQAEPVQVEAEGKDKFKFQTKINVDEKTADLMRCRQY